MSEAERLRRQEYKRNRKKWILIQTIAFALVLVIALTCFAVYHHMNRTYFIEYTENGNVDYKVFLKENDFYEQDYVGAGQSYISSLIENVTAKFEYELDLQAENVNFDYTYQVDAQLIIANQDTGDHIYEPTYVMVPKTKVNSVQSNRLSIKENLLIDYNKYNDIVKDFIKVYDLKRTTSTLVITMAVNVLSSCDELENSNDNSHFISLHIPLVEENFSMFTTSTNNEADTKVLACRGPVNQNLFLIIAIVALSLSVIQVGLLIFFICITRNEDVNYTNKVRKLLSSYRSFIQQMEGEFNVEGYQIVPIKTFNEMLGIRDTIQSPILMFENLDQTMTEFLIPTNTKILYTYCIKVENYDEIYGEPEEEPTVLAEAHQEEQLEVLPEEPDCPEVDPVVEDGVEVVGVVWPEKTKQNKVYRYDPNGEQLEKGDVVLVPTRDNHKDREVVRKVDVSHGNHIIEPDTHPYVLKKIIGVIKRHTETALAPKQEGKEEKEEKEK